jgi:alpha-galactosidase
VKTQGPKTWRIDAGAQTLVLATWGSVPEAVYWGATLPESEDIAALAGATRHDLTGGMLDRLPALSLCPHAEFQGQAGISVAMADGTPLHLAFTFKDAAATANQLHLISRAGGLTLTHSFTAHATGVLVMQTRLQSDAPIRVQWLAAPVLPAPQTGHMIDVHGKWTREFHLNHLPWTPGVRLREARTGRSGHEHPPYLILADDGCTNTAGNALALHYAFSGGHRMVAEELPDGRR